ncbi:MAG: carboxypeptidase M32 [Candidatus Thorarchaeota archaeon]|jgi:carboxypeptidase Taq
MNAYDELMGKFKEIVLLGTSVGMIYWDLETYMPPAGIQLRSEQISVLSKIGHEKSTTPEIGKLLEAAEKEQDSMNEVQKRNLFLARREYDIDTKIPSELIGRLTKQQAIATDVWKKAKAAKDWQMFEPELQKLIDVSREKEEIAMKVKGISSIYDSMLDQFERNMTASMIDKVFSQLRNRLVPLVQKCADASENVDASFLSRKIPIDAQRKIATDLGNLIGYDTTSDKARGRVDETEHPFTSGYYDDVRVTVHYYEDNLPSLVYAMLHEGGHALYEQNLNRDYMYQPIGVAASYGIHESMSRFVENIIGRTPQFWEYYLPKLNGFTNNAFSDISLVDFVRGVNLVGPTKIRIEADEVTYSLHVIIRFEIEKALFADKISVSELPQVWNEKYEEYLGVEIKDDAEGVLQDTHWGGGAYGYFPSYALGNVYDGQWLRQMNKDLPEWSGNIAKGELDPILSWLAKNIMSKASLYDPADLVKHVTGNELDAKPFLDFLEHKYAHMFGF